MALVSAGPDKLGKLTDALVKSDGASKKAADAMLNGWAGALTKMESAIDVTARTLTDALGPALNVVATGIMNVANWFNELSSAQQQIIAIGVAIVGVAVVVGGLVATFTALGISIGAMLGTMATFTGIGLAVAG